MTANDSSETGGEEPDDQMKAEFASILASRTVAIADDLHSTALDVEANASGAESLGDLADALEDARQEIEALDQLAKRADD